ncbi:MAG: hypothetical protein OXQ84_18780 [bacterium]|nr:hypothetical protein [bacterium]
MTALLDRTEFESLLSFWRSRAGVSFSVGVSGVIAEFHPPGDEPVTWHEKAGIMTGACPGGSIGIMPTDGILCVPYDIAGRTRGYLFCLEEASARMACHRVLRHAGSRGRAALFDIGAGAITVDALIIVDDPSLHRTLIQAEGERLVGTHHPALAGIVEAGPSRLFRSRLAEITVTGPIATTVTPEGPHTHLLVDLIDGTTHDDRISVPAGWLPCLTLHIPVSDPAFAGGANP